MSTFHLQKLITALGNKPSDEDAKQALQLVLPILLDIIQKLENRIEKLGIEKQIKISLPEIKFPESVEMNLRGVSVIKIKGNKGEKPIAGIDYIIPKNGKDVDEEKIINQILEKIPKPENGKMPIAGVDFPIPKDGSPDSAEDIRNKLELLEEDERLDKKAIKGLDEIERLARQKGGTIIGGGYVNRGMVKALDLSASLDGSTRTFDIQAVWKVISVHLSSFPTILRETVDYTWTPTSLTLTSEVSDAALSAGQTLIALVAEN